MCCFYTILLLLGSRFANVIWWIAEPVRWNSMFSSFIWPMLGIVFMPWTTLMYVLVAFNGLALPASLSGFDWMWMAFAVFADISMYAGGGYGNRDRIPSNS